MNTHRYFNYPIKLKKDKEQGGYTITLPDFPEAITQGEDLQDALTNATDCLEEAVANRIEMKLDIPVPSKFKKNQHYVSLHTTLAAKAALYLELKHQNLNNLTLAKKLNCDEKEVRRLLDPHHKSKLPRIESILEKFGLRLELSVVKVA